jgi:HAD superfamily hydrolase (TIGR01509 family)
MQISPPRLPFAPQAVIFDMDGLMLDSETVCRAVWRRAAGEQGFALSDAMYLGFVGRRTADCEALMEQLFGAGFSRPAFQTRAADLWHAHVRNYGLEHKPGLLELLDALERLHIPKAVATSTVRAEALVSLGSLFARFGALAAGDEVHNGKPAPDIFLLAAERLNADPTRCLALEDSEAGAIAATAAGMAAIIVPDLKQPSPEVAARALAVLPSLREVAAMLG